MQTGERAPKTQKRGAREGREPSPELEQEFEAIYKREYPVALRYARRSVDDDTAEDVVQEVFVNFWVGYVASPPLVFRRDAPEIVRASIIKAVRNRLCDKGRAGKRFRENRARIRENNIRTGRAHAPVDLGLGERELSALVDEAVSRLPARQREVFMLIKVDEMTYALTAAILGVSLSTVHQHLVKANALLRRELAPYRIPEPQWWFPIDETLNDEVDDDDRFPIDDRPLRRHPPKLRIVRSRDS